MKKITIASLEKHFVALADNEASTDSMLNEFASIVGARFIKFKYRFPDSYGVLITKNVVVNLFNNVHRNTFGFQALRYDGSVEAVLSSQNSDSTIIDTIMRLAPIIGCFSDDFIYDDNDSSSQQSSD
jgi:hypothetical protein